MSDSTSPTPEPAEGAAAPVAEIAPPAPYTAPGYTAPDPYVAQNPYVAPAPYTPGAAPAPYTPDDPAAGLASAPAASPAYQPMPTAPAPGALTPYSVGGPAYVYGAPRTNPLAIASFAVALGALIFGLLASIVAVVLGHIALSQIAKRGEGGRGLALAGVIIGYVLGGLLLLFLVFYIGTIVWAFNTYRS